MTSAEFWGRRSALQPYLGKFARFGRTLRVDASKDRETDGLLDNNHHNGPNNPG